jgi:hypothetical protein
MVVGPRVRFARSLVRPIAALARIAELPRLPQVSQLEPVANGRATIFVKQTGNPQWGRSDPYGSVSSRPLDSRKEDP